MSVAKTFIAASLIAALSIGPAFAEPLKCTYPLKDTKKKLTARQELEQKEWLDPNFDFTKASKTWRAYITGPFMRDVSKLPASASDMASAKPTCGQWVLNFTGKNTFTTSVVKSKTNPNVPDCATFEGADNPMNPLSGRIEVHCADLGNRIARWASISVWSPTTQPYGAIYSVMGLDKEDWAMAGFAQDAVAHHTGIAIYLAPEK